MHGMVFWIGTMNRMLCCSLQSLVSFARIFFVYDKDKDECTIKWIDLGVEVAAYAKIIYNLTNVTASVRL